VHERRAAKKKSDREIVFERAPLIAARETR
jgi:hypothetical protein